LALPFFTAVYAARLGKPISAVPLHRVSEIVGDAAGATSISVASLKYRSCSSGSNHVCVRGGRESYRKRIEIWQCEINVHAP
jgi:hypothetical protein